MGEFGFEESQVGYVMALQYITYLPMCLIMPHYCERSFPRKLQFVIAMFGFGLCCFMMGPSQLLYFPQNFQIIILAFPLIGVFQYFVFIPIIPEMLERLIVDLKVVEGADPDFDATIYDKVNDAYGFIYAVSMFVGPLVGGYMHDHLGGPTTGDYMGFTNLALGALLFTFNCGPLVFRENRQFFSHLDKLKNEGDSDSNQDKGNINQHQNDDYTSINKRSASY